MQLETIVTRISECIDDLGCLLDRIYKFPQKQRELYFDKIQSMKNKLLTLKTNVRQSNATLIQKQYKQLYLAMNSLKSEITQQINLIPILKQSKQMNRPKDKQVKKNHAEVMKLLVQKEQQISQLKKIVFQKEELIRINYQELKKTNQERSFLIQENRSLKLSYQSLEVDFKSAQMALVMAEQSLKNNENRNMQKDEAFNTALLELQRLKNQLIAANNKISHFQQLAEISMNKTRIVEENMRKIQKDARDLNDNFRIKQTDILKKVRQTSELEYQLANSIDAVKQLELQNKRLKQDLQVLQNQVTKLHKSLDQTKAAANQSRDRFMIEKKQFISQIGKRNSREDELIKELQEADQKYLIAVNKVSIVQDYRLKLKEVQIRNQSLEDNTRKLEQLTEDLQRQLQNALRQKDKINQHSSQIDIINRQLEVEIFRFKEKSMIKEQQRIKMYQQLQISHNKVKQYERMLASKEIILQSVKQELLQGKTRESRLEEKYHSRDKEIQGLKTRLLKAKIEAIHQIRSII